MGQYYEVVLKDATGNYSRYEPDNGLKLMEFSYFGTSIVNTVLEKLRFAPHRVMVIGDYAEDKHLKNKDFDLSTVLPLDDMYNKVVLKPNTGKENDCEEYVVNFSKGLYYKIDKNDEYWIIFKLFLLCSIGNGQGGGDYYGVNEDECGTWFGDMISVVPEEKLDKNLLKEYQVEFNDL